MILFDCRWVVHSSKWGTWNMCASVRDWLRHNWGLLWHSWEGGQVFKSSLSSSSSFFCPRYDSEGKYLGSLPDLATPRRYHSCTSFLSSNGEQVRISTSCSIIFLLYFKQAFLVAGGYNGDLLASTEIFADGSWTTGGNLPRWKYLSNHLN